MADKACLLEQDYNPDNFLAHKTTLWLIAHPAITQCVGPWPCQTHVQRIAWYAAGWSLSSLQTERPCCVSLEF